MSEQQASRIVAFEDRKQRATPNGFRCAYSRLGKAKFDNPERKKALDT